MVFDLNCNRNIPPTSTSSCTELLYDACHTQHGGPPHCQRCCINSMLNDHTYCVLKKICRKIIKDFNRQQCREKYTVFDGGNSVNVRIHRSLSTGTGTCVPQGEHRGDRACRGDRGDRAGRGDRGDRSDRAGSTTSGKNIKNKKNLSNSTVEGSQKLDSSKSKTKRNRDTEQAGADDTLSLSKKQDKGKSKGKKKQDEDDGEIGTSNKDKRGDKSKSKDRKSKLDDEDDDHADGKRGKKKGKKKGEEDDDLHDGGGKDKGKDKGGRSKSKGRKSNLDDDDDSQLAGGKSKSKRKLKGRPSEDLPIVSDLRDKVRKGHDVSAGAGKRGKASTDGSRMSLNKRKPRRSSDTDAHLRSKSSKGRDGRRSDRRLTKDGKDRFNDMQRNNGRINERSSQSKVGDNSYVRKFMKRSRSDEVKPCDYLRANMEQRELYIMCKNRVSPCTCYMPCGPCGACKPCKPCNPCNPCDPCNPICIC